MVESVSTGLQTVRIFLASSAELAEHRNAFDLHVRRLNDRWRDKGLYLTPVRWENFIEAMSATRLQGEYNKAIAGCDIFVMLFRTKVGMYTAEEFEKAFGQFLVTGKPLVYSYFHDSAIKHSAVNQSDMQSLWAFQAQLKALGHFQTQYENTDRLLLHFGEQLEKLHHQGHFGQPLAATRATPSVATQPNPQQLIPYLQRRAAHWRSSAAGQLDRKFVNLTLLLDRGLEHDGPRHSEDGRYSLLSEVLAERADVAAWVLVGAPGAGKSTVLQHHELRSAEAALQALAAPADLTTTTTTLLPEVCIWHRLSEYSASSPPPEDWLALPARWPQDLPPLAQLRRMARVRFVLDGLNEIKAPNRSTQLEAIERWTTCAAVQAERAARQGDAGAPVFSVRTLDQSPLSSGSFEVRQLVLAPWTDEQINDYCSRELGANNALWPAIKSDPALMELSALPFNLAAQCTLFRTLGRPAQDRAELMSGLFWQTLEKRLGDAPLKPPGLLGEAERRHITSGQWKKTLRALPDREGCLVPWLDEALQHLHRRGRQVSVTQAELLAPLQPLSQSTGAATFDEWLYAVRSLQLIDEGGYDEFSAQPLLRCTHQLWQEFFAARGIRERASSDPASLPSLAPPPLLELHSLELGVQEPLTGPDPTHWEEPVKLAVQLVSDPLPWLQVLQPQNLALAARAALAVRERLERLHGPAVLEGLRSALLARSRDPAADLRLRIEAGLLLGDLGDPRYELRQGPHGPYLWPRQWVRVPSGLYRIGDQTSDEADEKPETEVQLAPYEVAFAPVTNAEFRCFVDAGGYEDERWWQGSTALRWLKEGIRNEVDFEARSQDFAKIRTDVAAWIAARPGLTVSAREQYRELAKQPEAEHMRLLDDWYGARTFRQPQEWHNPQFNQAAQPVVGICQFEARAYACWLQAQTAKPTRLPTEAEWEVAARGRERRPWPWSGPEEPNDQRFNADPAHLRRTSPVGVFVQANTPEGLTDLAGNVWEWTTSAYTDRLQADALTTEAPDDLARRVVRGGSWNNTTANGRTAYRSRNAPDNRNNNLGFRLVVSCHIRGAQRQLRRPVTADLPSPGGRNGAGWSRLQQAWAGCCWRISKRAASRGLCAPGAAHPHCLEAVKGAGCAASRLSSAPAQWSAGSHAGTGRRSSSATATPVASPAATGPAGCRPGAGSRRAVRAGRGGPQSTRRVCPSPAPPHGASGCVAVRVAKSRCAAPARPTVRARVCTTMTASPESGGAAAVPAGSCAGLWRLSEWDMLVTSWRRAAQGKQGDGPVARFSWAVGEQLLALQQRLRNGSWQPGPYAHFTIHEPKQRRISAAPFADRVVHHALCQVIEPRFEPHFCPWSYANRVGGGTHRAVTRVQQLARRHAWVLRLDVQKHFPSLDHAVLRKLLWRRVPEPGLRELINRVLASGDGIHDGHPALPLFPGDDLLALCRPRGLPIGNLTSQVRSNVYMHPLDNHVLRSLRCSAYLRYVDDFALFADSAAELNAWRAQLLEFLAQHLRLRVHENAAQVQRCAGGIPWLGFVVYPEHRRVKARKVVQATRRLREKHRAWRAGELGFVPFDASVQGWINHVRYADTWGLREHVLGQLPLQGRPLR